MLRDCLTIVARDDTVSVTRLSVDLELDHRIGDLIADGVGGHWSVEEVVLEERHLVVSEVVVEERRSLPAPELLAA